MHKLYTATQSLWQNGTCELNQVVVNRLEKIQEENINLELD